MMKPIKPSLFVLMIVLAQWPFAEALSKDMGKWYGVEEATIYFDVKGTQTGKIVRHFRNWGNQQVEINQTQMNMMGMNIPTNQKTITEGEWITSVDLTKRTATKMKNPMYESVRKSMKGKSGVEAGKAYARSMGGRETGKTATYAGEKCDIWEMGQMGGQTCVTKDGLAIWFQANVGGGMQMTHTATKIVRGDPGPKAAYEVGPGIKVKAQDSRDLGEIMKKMRRRQAPPDGTGKPAGTEAPNQGKMPPDVKQFLEMFKKRGE